MNFLKKLLSKKVIYEFIPDETGAHQLGGDIPQGFIIPQNNFVGGFQYIGKIDNSVEPFLWIPFPLHMICPIYLNIEVVMLDHSDPNTPKLLYPKETASITHEYPDELKNDSVVTYEAVKFSTKEIEGINEDNEYEIMGIGGEPNWIQSSLIPRCPKSGRKMKFVCQLYSNGHVQTKYTNVVSEDKYMMDYFRKMNFWCDGCLYVFMEPEARTVCYFIQNT